MGGFSLEGLIHLNSFISPNRKKCVIRIPIDSIRDSLNLYQSRFSPFCASVSQLPRAPRLPDNRLALDTLTQEAGFWRIFPKCLECKNMQDRFGLPRAQARHSSSEDTSGRGSPSYGFILQGVRSKVGQKARTRGLRFEGLWFKFVKSYL